METAAEENWSLMQQLSEPCCQNSTGDNNELLNCGFALSHSTYNAYLHRIRLLFFLEVAGK